MIGVEEMIQPQVGAGGGEDDSPHVPVLVEEVLGAMGMRAGAELDGWIVDATLGAAGHARALLERFPRVRVLGIDQDPSILRHAGRALHEFGARARLRRARMSELGAVLMEEGLGRVQGVLLDLGLSSLQIDDAQRGFSFLRDGPLDMRMDPSRDRTAADIVNGWDEADLADLFYHEGDERKARKIAHAIVEARRRAPFARSLPLADLVARAAGGAAKGRIHPATRTFQALRRAVNEESQQLARGLEFARDWLADGGRLVVISFHSGEDRLVKRFLVQGQRSGDWRPLAGALQRAGEAEVRRNRRARSARLRAAERTRGAPGVPGALLRAHDLARQAGSAERTERDRGGDR
jgi:16S rRNA (cytosine1402-N4)-methyltransferase